MSRLRLGLAGRGALVKWLCEKAYRHKFVTNDEDHHPSHHGENAAVHYVSEDRLECSKAHYAT